MNNSSEEVHDLFQILLEIQLAMIEAGEPNSMLKVLLDSAVQLFNVQACSLAMHDLVSGGLRFNVHYGKGDVRRFFVPESRGFAGWVFKKGQPVLCNEPKKDPRFFGHIDEKSGVNTDSLMCAPLRHGDRILGVIQVLNTRRKEGFTATDLKLLTSFGQMAGAAIRGNTTLMEAGHAGSIYRQDAELRYALVYGKSPAMTDLVMMAKKVAVSPTTVLLMSESGTGKEVTAHSIHRWSSRSQAPFVAINCVALTPELLGSELFGHEKGAFTGASERKIGKFELAHSGTIFLDEIGELNLDLQASLLRVLQEREFQRVGGSTTISTDVRIIAATNRNLRQAVARGTFREDLFYRINVITLELPPLRRRREDIVDLTQHFLKLCCREAGRPPMEIHPRAMAVLQAYDWPGNVRQLRNTIERAVVLSTGSVISEANFPAEVLAAEPVRVGQNSVGEKQKSNTVPDQNNFNLAEALATFKRNHVQTALNAAKGNQGNAAKLLGLHASNLSRLMKNLGIAVK